MPTRRFQKPLPKPATPPTPPPAAPQPVPATERLDSIQKMLESRIKFAAEAIDEWKIKLNENPAEAFYWSADTFEKAARLDACGWFLKAIVSYKADTDRKYDAEEMIRHLWRHAQSGAMQAARFPSHSTSPTANLIATCRGAEYAELAHDLADFMEVKS
jgi:hypothetical protein